MIMTSAEAEIGEARRATSEYVSRRCPYMNADDVVLVVSELVTNAVEHTVGWWRLRVRVYRRRLVVEIEDANEAPPVRRVAKHGAEGGRGLYIVQRLADSVEVLRRTGGKTVRASWSCP